MSRIVVTKPAKQELQKLGVTKWPIWTCEVSQFDWHYDDRETCYILEGSVVVTGGGQTAEFGKGDLVVFPKGLDCVWDVRSAVRKHYKFG